MPPLARKAHKLHPDSVDQPGVLCSRLARCWALRLSRFERISSATRAARAAFSARVRGECFGSADAGLAGEGGLAGAIGSLFSCRTLLQDRVSLWHLARASSSRRSSGVEHTLGKGGVEGSIPSGGTTNNPSETLGNRPLSALIPYPLPKLKRE